ncbi:MAG: response regulator [Thalassovita sp.]|nr:response regulator [Thalassovita sp.]
MDDSDHFQSGGFPTPSRPLTGLTLLAVEDSRFAFEAFRLLALHSGARLRRADSLTAAERHLAIYRPSAIIVDLGLPDGDGTRLIAKLHHAIPRIGIILGTSGDDAADDAVRAAGADGFLAKPVRSLATFQELILSLLPGGCRPLEPRVVNDEEIRPDTLTYHEDLAHIAELLRQSPEGRGLDYVAQFLTSIARSAGDLPLLSAGEALTIARMQQRACLDQVARITDLLRDRIDGRSALQRGI